MFYAHLHRHSQLNTYDFKGEFIGEIKLETLPNSGNDFIMFNGDLYLVQNTLHSDNDNIKIFVSKWEKR